MELQRSSCCFCFYFCLLLVLCMTGEAYKNYTVGGSMGWYDNQQLPKADYQKWADANNYSLGDFLIFKTDNNHTVIQTYNLTTYKRCDFNNAGDDAIKWSAGQQVADNEVAAIAVPLLKEGATYFFSSNYDGEQCEHGQHFKITVAHGQGLPPSLLPGAGSAPGPNNADYASSTPDTVVPSNFDNPKDTGEDDGAVKRTSGACGIPTGLGRSSLGVVIMVLLTIFGGKFICIYT